MMRTLLMIALGAALVCAASADIKEANTGQNFPETLQAGGKALKCTGVDFRKEYMFSIYAIAHYGDPQAKPKDEAAKDPLSYWRSSPAAKALVLRFVFSVSEDQMRAACELALDRTQYKGDNRKPFLNAFSQDYSEGAEVRLLVLGDGLLRAEISGKSAGEWKDADLVKALWTCWLGEQSVLVNRKNLVARPLD